MTRILLLTAPGCHWCDEAEALIEKLAAEFELETATCSTEDEAGRSLALASGVLFPPGLFVNDELLQYGRPSERKLRACLVAIGARPRTASAR